MPPEAIPPSRQRRRAPGALPRWLRPAGRDYLGVALLISLCVHSLVLLWHWHAAPASQAPAAWLDVVLVNAQTPTAPLHPQVLAQQALDGGGDGARAMAASPLPLSAANSPDAQVLRAIEARQTALERQQEELLTQLRAAEHHAVNAAHASATDADATTQAQRMLASRIAALQARIAHDNAQPRRQFDAPAAAEAPYAAYVEAWRLRIEQLGTQHYPPEARGRIYGSLQLTVFIRRDGSLERVEIDRPSEHAVLNLAAQRIVHLAAPFAPLPAEIARSVDVLAITRTWLFTDQHLDTAP